MGAASYVAAVSLAMPAVGSGRRSSSSGKSLAGHWMGVGLSWADGILDGER